MQQMAILFSEPLDLLNIIKEFIPNIVHVKKNEFGYFIDYFSNVDMDKIKKRIEDEFHTTVIINHSYLSLARKF